MSMIQTENRRDGGGGETAESEEGSEKENKGEVVSQKGRETPCTSPFHVNVKATVSIKGEGDSEITQIKK